MAKKWTINNWNASIDRTKTVVRMGKNGIWYEYLIPINGNPLEYYNDAIDVRSRKSSTSKWNNGKKPGQYQPIGDKKYFNYYQLKKMKETNNNTGQLGELIVEGLREVFSNER